MKEEKKPQPKPSDGNWRARPKKNETASSSTSFEMTNEIMESSWAAIEITPPMEEGRIKVPVKGTGNPIPRWTKRNVTPLGW